MSSLEDGDYQLYNDNSKVLVKTFSIDIVEMGATDWKSLLQLCIMLAFLNYLHIQIRIPVQITYGKMSLATASHNVLASHTHV